MPLRNTRVIHPQFEAHHRPVSEHAMPAECVITRTTATSSTFDEATGTTVFAAPTPVYDGSCRVQHLGSAARGEAAATDVADRILALAHYEVVIPTAANLVEINDTVTITACQGDPDLVGRTLQVTGERRSGLTWDRVISCQMQQPISR